MYCEKCKKEFNPQLCNIEIKNKNRIIHCPHCNLKYIYIKMATNLVRDESGCLRRKLPYVKMKKKERMKMRLINGNK
jgi:DNA-directed RNA polymerase subunit RPC12/RpoP